MLKEIGGFEGKEFSKFGEDDRQTNVEVDLFAGSAGGREGERREEKGFKSVLIKDIWNE